MSKDLDKEKLTVIRKGTHALPYIEDVIAEALKQYFSNQSVT